jgi:predicted ATP-grasp superfamily ATP-dependent carboligase
MNVLILDGNQNQAVASVRSLAHAGHTVFVGESASWSKAGWSRSAAGSVQYVDPKLDTRAFLNNIVEFVGHNPNTLVLPMTEATTLPVSTHRAELAAAGAVLVLPAHSDLLRAFDKDETTRLAASLGISVPRTVLVNNEEQAVSASKSVKYPVVLKPKTSETAVEGKVRTGGRPRYARAEAEMLAAYRDIASRASEVLVQEYVPGEGTGYFALMHHGELRAEFAHRRIRDVYPTGSGSAVRVSVEPDPEIRRVSLAMLSALHWHGVAMVEYRKQSGSPPVFMEVNGRFWHSLPLACYAGVDFPALLAAMAEKGDIEPCHGYSYGVHCRWFLGDFRHLVEVFQGPPSGYPGIYPGKFRTLLDVLTPVPGTYHDLFQWADPVPELGDWILGFTKIAKGA